MDHQAINRDNWDSRADVHLSARGYAPDKVADPSWISHVVAFDRPRRWNCPTGNTLNRCCGTTSAPTPEVRPVQRSPEVVSPWTRKRCRNKKTTSIGRIAISEPMKSSG